MAHLAITTSAFAQVLYWSGSGTWNATNSNWGTISGGPYGSVWGATNTATFEGTAGTVTVSASQTAVGLDFDVANYILNVNSSQILTVNGNVTGESFQFGGAGILRVTSTASNFTGGVTINGGNLNYRPGGTLDTSFGSGAITLDGGTFTIGSGTLTGVAVSATTGQPTTPGQSHLSNNFVVTSTGGTLALAGGSTNSGTANVFEGQMNLAGSLRLTSAGGGNSGGIYLTGNIVLDQSTTGTPRINSETGHNGSDAIVGTVSDSAGPASNPLTLRTTNRTLLFFNNSHTYSHGTVVQGGGGLVDVQANAQLGTGGLATEAGARVILRAPATNLAAGQEIVAAAGSVVGIGTNTDAQDRFGSASAGIYGIDGGTAHSYNIDLANLGNGGMFIGSVAGGTWSGAFTSAGTGNVYRLGGGYLSGISTPPSPLIVSGADALSGTAGLVVGDTAPGGANLQRVVISNDNSFTGGVKINAGAVLATNLDATRTPWGPTSGPIEVFGTLAVTGANGQFNPDYLPNVTMRPGSTLLLNNLPNFGNSTGGANNNRLPDSTNLTLNNWTLRLEGARSADVAETIGMLTVENIGTVALSKNATSGQDTVLTVAGITRTGNGVLLVKPGTAGNLGTATDNNGERLVVAGLTAASNTNGIYAPWIIDATGHNHVAYNDTLAPDGLARGFVPATYSSTSLATAGVNDTVNSASGTLSNNPSVYALRLSGGMNASGGNNTITIGAGGLILTTTNNASSSANFAFGANEGLIYANILHNVNGAISGTAGVTKSGGGTIRLGGNNSGLTGGLRILQGTVRAEPTGNFNVLNGNDLFINAGATLELSGSSGTMGAGSLSGAGLLRAISTRTLLLAQEGNSTFSGQLSNGTGTLSLTKNGTGTLTLSGTATNTASGVLDINGGGVVLNTNWAGNVTVDNTDTILSGNGTIGGSLTIGTGAILAPGNSPGTMTTTSLTLDPGSVLRIEIFGTGAGQFDQIVSSSGGNLVLTDANLQLYIDPGFDGTIDNLGIFSSFGSVSGNFASISFSPGSNPLFASVDFNPLTGTVSAIPEPGALAAIFGGVAFGWVVWQRRRRHAPKA